MISKAFSDSFAHKCNFFTGIDARVKIILVLGAIIMILFSSLPYLPLTITFVFLVCLLAVRIPVKIILFRLLGPLSITIVILLIQIFLTGYKEGLNRGILIMGKTIGSVTSIMFLGMTTQISALFQAASWFKVPKVWLEVAAITYRYIFVLIEDAITIRDAQKVRLGYCNYKRSLKSLAELIGSCLIRAYDQSVSTYEAMRIRGSAH